MRSKFSNISLYLILFLVLIFSSYATPYSTTWFSSGNTFTLDNNIFTILLDGSGNDTRILLDSNSDDYPSNILNLYDCYETILNKVCFTDYESLSPTQNKVKGEFSKIINSISISNDIDNSDPYIFDTIRVTHNVSTIGDVNNLSFSVFIPETVTVVKTNGCNLEENSFGKFIKYTTINPDSDTFYYDLYSEIPETFEISAAFNYLTPTDNVNSSTTSDEINFNFPYTYTFTNEFNNNSNLFELNFSFFNPAEEEVTFSDLNILFPNTLTIDEDTYPSSLISGYDYLIESFSLDYNETKNFSYEILVDDYQKENIFILPEFKYGSHTYEGSYYDSHLLDFSLSDLNKIDKVYNCSSVYINYSLDNNATLLPGSEIDFNIYLKNNNSDELSNAKLNLLKDNLTIGYRTYDKVLSYDKLFFSRVYEIVPFVESAKDIKYLVNLEYSCGGEQFIKSFEENISIAPFATVSITSDAPGTMTYGDSVKVTVSIENEDDVFVNNVILRDTIPEELSYDGVIERSISLDGESEVDAYSYYVEPLVNKDGEVSIFTEVILIQGEFSKLITNEEIITLEKKDITFFDVDVVSETKYLDEPSILKFSITNDHTETINDLDISVDESVDYLIPDFNELIPFINPGQTIYFDLPIIFKETNSSVNIVLNSFIEDTIEEFNITSEAKRVDVIFPSYDLEETTYSSGSIITEVIVQNPSDQVINIKLNSEMISLNGNSNKSISLENSYESINLTYNLLGTDFILSPDTIAQEYIDESISKSDDVFNNSNYSGLNTSVNSSLNSSLNSSFNSSGNSSTVINLDPISNSILPLIKKLFLPIIIFISTLFLIGIFTILVLAVVYHFKKKDKKVIFHSTPKFKMKKNNKSEALESSSSHSDISSFDEYENLKNQLEEEHKNKLNSKK